MENTKIERPTTDTRHLLGDSNHRLDEMSCFLRAKTFFVYLCWVVEQSSFKCVCCHDIIFDIMQRVNPNHQRMQTPPQLENLAMKKKLSLSLGNSKTTTPHIYRQGRTNTKSYFTPRVIECPTDNREPEPQKKIYIYIYILRWWRFSSKNCTVLIEHSPSVIPLPHPRPLPPALCSRAVRTVGVAVGTVRVPFGAQLAHSLYVFTERNDTRIFNTGKTGRQAGRPQTQRKTKKEQSLRSMHHQSQKSVARDGRIIYRAKRKEGTGPA